MGRRPRSDFDGGWHHVMNRGAARQETFLNARHYADFERLLGVGHDRFGVQVHGYCLMPNHFHLLLHCPDGDLSGYMHVLASTYASHFNEDMGRDGPLFRGRFHSIVVDSDEYFLNAIRYIHRNPLDLPSHDIGTYRWSSFRVYTGHRRTPCWMRTERALGCFESGVDGFTRFVLEERDAAVDVDTRVTRDLIDLTIDAADDGLARQGLARTIELLLDVHPGDDEAHRAAVRRAKRRAAAEPRIAALAEHVRRLAA